MEAVEDTYTFELQTPGRMYANVTPGELFAHLKNTYGMIYPHETNANRKRLRNPWNRVEPIGNLWKCIGDICAFATFARQSITESDKLSETLQALIDCPTGKYREALKYWDMQPPEWQTWANLFEHINCYEQNYDKTTTANGAGFGGANTAEAEAEVKPATEANAASVTPEKNQNNFYRKPGAVVVTYCHTCGHLASQDHDSKTCPKPGPNHDKTANFWNYQEKGGDMKIDNSIQNAKKSNKKRKQK